MVHFWAEKEKFLYRSLRQRISYCKRVNSHTNGAEMLKKDPKVVGSVKVHFCPRKCTFQEQEMKIVL